jgi:uncharacterized protein
MKSLIRSSLTTVATLLFLATLAQAQLSKPFLWELSKGEGKDAKVVTLFGSLHVGKPDFYPVPDAVQKRFDEAKVLAVEADVTVAETQQVCTKLAETKEKLESVLSSEDFAALGGYLRAASIPEAAIEGKKLWLVNLVVLGAELAQLGVDFARGLDVVFLREAKHARMKVVEVEGGATQCGVLANASAAETKAAMTRFLESVRQNKMEKRLNEMLTAYRAGDGAALSRLVAEDFGATTEGASARRRIFDDRHPPMAEKIDGYFKQPENHFVVVGVGHMFGDNNLLEALAKRGIKAKRIG